MVNKFIVVLVFAAFVLVPLVASAEDVNNLTGRYSLGLVSGGVFPKDSDIDNRWYIGGNFAYGLNEYLAVGAEVGYTSWDDEENGIDYGDVRAVPLLADVYLRYPIESGDYLFVPYIVGGVGVVFCDYDESSLLENNGISIDIDTELGVKLGGGFEYLISKNVALNFEGSYLWSDADATISGFGTYAAAELDTDAWIINGGLKYYFD